MGLSNLDRLWLKDTTNFFRLARFSEFVAFDDAVCDLFAIWPLAIWPLFVFGVGVLSEETFVLPV